MTKLLQLSRIDVAHLVAHHFFRRFVCAGPTEFDLQRIGGALNLRAQVRSARLAISLRRQPANAGTGLLDCYPFYAIRLFGGTLFLAGMLIMAYNVWKTLADSKTAPVPVAEPA